MQRATQDAKCESLRCSGVNSRAITLDHRNVFAFPEHLWAMRLASQQRETRSQQCPQASRRELFDRFEGPIETPSHHGEQDMKNRSAQLIAKIRATQEGGEIPKTGLVMNEKLRELIRHTENAQRMARLPASVLVDAMTLRKQRQVQSLIARRLTARESVKSTSPKLSRR